jgi:hypothetical protein
MSVFDLSPLDTSPTTDPFLLSLSQILNINIFTINFIASRPPPSKWGVIRVNRMTLASESLQRYVLLRLLPLMSLLLSLLLSCILGLELPMPVSIHNAIPLHNTSLIYDCRPRPPSPSLTYAPSPTLALQFTQNGQIRLQPPQKHKTRSHIRTSIALTSQ